MILLLDNYDSFVHNLARYVRELGEEAVVHRNDTLTLDDVAAMAPSHIIISPGPCTPAESGISTDVVLISPGPGRPEDGGVSLDAIRELAGAIPLLGVCLGHQCIGAAYGGDIVRAGRPMHGKTSKITHDATGVFADLPSPFHATRYHSLVIAPDSLPHVLRVTATADDDGEIMGVVHREYPVTGVQFHPESALTQFGYQIVDRFLHR
jgi:anthranilate synthase component 2